MGSLDRYYKVLENPPEQIRVVAFGDSNTELLYITKDFHNWVAWFTLGVCSNDGVTRTRVMNSGFSGSTITDSLNRVHVDVTDYNPDLVIIGFGTNDQASVPPETTKKNLQRMLDMIYEKCPLVSVLIRIPQPLYRATPDGKGEWDNTPAMLETVEAMRSVANEFRIDVVDHFKLWQEPDQDFPPSHWMFDIFHANASGHGRFYHDMRTILKLPLNPLTPPPWPPGS